MEPYCDLFFNIYIYTNSIGANAAPVSGLDLRKPTWEISKLKCRFESNG